ncbi:hypothetical protein M0R45_009471 [Rubus argutus]|uniref:Trafficking protein particle complex subunit n=1 Tax=Rubus argutus TaxID=59490 RepID=A0AAW1Y4K2_RUBAR
MIQGTKFFVVSEPGKQRMEGLLKHIYELYTDFVLKNPFYEMEMPIRCELFDINLTLEIQKDHERTKAAPFVFTVAKEVAVLGWVPAKIEGDEVVGLGSGHGLMLMGRRQIEASRKVTTA